VKPSQNDCTPRKRSFWQGALIAGALLVLSGPGWGSAAAEPGRHMRPAIELGASGASTAHWCVEIDLSATQHNAHLTRGRIGTPKEGIGLTPEVAVAPVFGTGNTVTAYRVHARLNAPLRRGVGTGQWTSAWEPIDVVPCGAGGGKSEGVVETRKNVRTPGWEARFILRVSVVGERLAEPGPCSTTVPIRICLDVEHWNWVEKE
jgi:hypothetical protein